MKDDILMIEAALEKNIALYVTEKHLREACHYSLLSGGKRLRPVLVLEFNRLFDGTQSHALQAATAIEFIHCYSLIHDDLPAMDDDDLRRGKPTLHKKYDDATAILAGDALLTAAFEILSVEAAHTDPFIRCRLIQTLAHAAGGAGMVCGQYEDMRLTPHFDHENIDHISLMQSRKTGALITAACLMGALSANMQDNKILDRVKEYGFHIGIAFQLKDDILDMTSTEERIGKKTRKDKGLGKATLPQLIGLDRAEDKLDNHIQAARAILAQIADEESAKAILHLTEFIGNREY
ncbi:MAG: polyprenyl synthetase family protein [Pseudomonadota bacterium]